MTDEQQHVRALAEQALESIDHARHVIEGELRRLDAEQRRDNIIAIIVIGVGVALIVALVVLPWIV